MPHLLPATSAASPTKIHSFRRKSFLPLIPEQIWQIEDGVVRVITWNEDGYVTTLGIWGRGDVVGHPLTRQQPCQIECLSNVKAIALPWGDHSRHWSSILLHHLWHQEDLIRIIHQPSVTERLKQFLHWLAHRFGKPVSEGKLLAPLLTHQQLAEILGTTRVTVTRSLTHLEQEGQVIKFKQSIKQNTEQAKPKFSGRTLLIVKPA